ncbi:unnamed protein product, partial [Symbiodinium sp. CCMP2456]
MLHLDTDQDQLMQNAAQSMQLTLSGTDAKREYLTDGHDDTELFVQMREAVRSKLLKRTSHMSSAFIRAAADGNIDQVDLLLRKRVQVNTTNCDGRTAMHLAAAEGREQVMKLLIEAEGNVNKQDRWKGSPLKDAVLGKFVAVTELLVEQQADLNLDDPATALCDAASSGNLVALKELIEVKINPDSGDYDLRTPLHLAASEGKLEVISFLLESKANPNFKDRWGGTALEDAIQNNHTVVAQLIFSKRGQLRQELAAGWLCDAASAGNIVKLQQLAENSVDVNLADYDSRTALHLAATEGQLLAVSFLLGTARANSSPQDRWLSTPLQDAIRAGHVHCARLLAFAGAALGDSATDEDRKDLCELYAEDMASSSNWGHIQVFQRRMTELQQRVARLLVAVLKGRARPEVFDAEASARFNRQLIGAVLRQCPQIAEQMVGMSNLLRRLNATAIAPMSSFLALLQDCIDCTQHSKWWAWHDKQGGTSQRPSKKQDKGNKEAKLDKSTGMVTKLMVSTMGICSTLSAALAKAAALIQERVNKTVEERHLKTKVYVIDDEYLASMSAHNSPSYSTASTSGNKRRKKGGARSVAGSVKAPSMRSARSQRTQLEDMTEDPRESGSHLSIICTEAVFDALEWEIDWTAPTSQNYGINAGPLKTKLEELANSMVGSQSGVIMDLIDSLTHTSVQAWPTPRAGCVDDAAEAVRKSRRNMIPRINAPLANELALLSFLALLQTAPMNIDGHPSNEKVLQRMDICVLRSGLELATAEVKGDIAKARKELSKQNKVSRKQGKKWLVGGRFGQQNNQPVAVGRILTKQRDLPPEDICAIIDIQDPDVQTSQALSSDEDEDDDKKQVMRHRHHRRREDVHILPHKPVFGSMGPLRFQLNILQYILDFSSLQQDAINEAEERAQIEEDEKKKVKTLQGREPRDDGPIETVVMSDGQTITLDRKYMKSMAEINSNTDCSSENIESEDASDPAGSNVSSGGAASPASYRGANTRVARHRSEHGDGIPKASRLEFCKGILASFGILRGGDDGNGRVKQRVARKFRELDEDGEGISLADVATLLTDVLGRKLDRDAMLRLAANVFDNAEKSEQDLLQLADVLGSLESVTADFNALVKRREQHSSGQTANDGEMSWACVQRLSGLVLPPDSIWLRVWDTLRRGVIIYFMLEVPMRFAISNVDMLPEPSRTIFLTINVSFDAFMFLNLLLTFMRGYVQSSGVTVMDFHQIRVRYLLGNFSWDVLACFPIDLLVAGFYDSREYATWRLFKLLHLRHLFGKGQGRVSETSGGFLFTCFKIMLQLYVLLHFMACTLWYLGNGWPTDIEFQEQTTSGYDGPGWFRIYEGMSHRLGVVNQPHVPVLEQYVLSLYGMMLLLTNDSTDLLNPSSYYELGWLIVCFIVSVAL